MMGIVTFLIMLMIKLLRVLLKQAFTSVFTCIDLIQFILSTQIIVVWIQVINFKNFTIDENGNDPDVIASSNQLSNFQDYYRMIVHFSSFITFMRILQFFSFSKKLSAFTEILSSAKYDILFFVLMFAFVRIST